MKVKLDKITHGMARDYADTEAEIGGFDGQSPKWKKAYDHYLQFAAGTLAVGRNPRGAARFAVKKEFYPDVFGAEGFAGKTQRKLKLSGDMPIDLQAAQNRILSSVVNLVKMYEGGILGIKTTTSTRKEGHLTNDQISGLQFPEKGKESEEEWNAKLIKVIRRWYLRDLLTDVVLESLQPFFNMSVEDTKTMMMKIDTQIEVALKDQGVTVSELKSGGREELIKTLRAKQQPAFAKLSYKKILFDEQ